MTRGSIAINALSAMGGGGLTYIQNLLAHSGSTQLEVIGLCTNRNKHLFAEAGYAFHVPRLVSRHVLFRVLWETFFLRGWLVKRGVDVFYCPGGILPPRLPCPAAVAFQNMLPFDDRERKRYPLSYIRARLFLLRGIFARSFKRADFIIFISRYAREVIQNTLVDLDTPSAVIPHGLNDAFKDPDPPKPNHPRLPEEYVCYVSIVTVYKSHLALIRAWSVLRERRPTREKLVFIGGFYPPYHKEVVALIRELGLEEEVILLGKAPYRELPGYYRGAKINLFASTCENCPNILLEALSAGKPVLCSEVPPMPEFGGDAVIYFDPSRPETLTEPLVSLLDDPKARARWGEKALKRSTLFDWDTAASKTFEILANCTAKAIKS